MFLTPIEKNHNVEKGFDALAVIVVVFVGIVAMQSSEFRVTRTATISTPAPAVFAQVNDLHNQTWSPWAKLDPAVKMTSSRAVGRNRCPLQLAGK